MSSTQRQRALVVSGDGRPSFRPDIEGLRAIAVLSVMLYHIGFPVSNSGFVGVDVFFVISGFLITGLLVREIEIHQRINLPAFWAKRARRLLPAAGLVLVFVMVCVWAFFPETTWHSFGMDSLSASFYVVNWRLAASAVDYLAGGTGLSPVQHYWSLAVEEQFYLLWPVVLALVAWLVRKHNWRRLRLAMGGSLAVLTSASFAWSVVFTKVDPQQAFFVTPTRLWELGVGGLVSIISQAVGPLSGWASRLCGSVGLAGLLVSLVFLSHVDWPSWWAAIPVLSVALVIMGGMRDLMPTKWLAIRPLVWIGSLSYSLYLWHWPMLIVAQRALGSGFAWTTRLAATVASFLPAYLSYRFIENKVRFSPVIAGSTMMSLLLAMSLSLASATAALGLVAAIPRTIIPYESLGAATLQSDGDGRFVVPMVDQVSSIVPSPSDASADLPDAYKHGCQQSLRATRPKLCVYGDPSGTRSMLLAGDSKIVQWLSPLDTIAKERHIRLLVATKSSCSFTGASVEYTNTSCDQYNANLKQVILNDPPDIMITSNDSSQAHDDGGGLSHGAMVAGLTSLWRELTAQGIRVILLENNPDPGSIDGGIPACVADHMNDLSACAFSLDDGVARSNREVQETAAERAQIDRVDLVDVLCSDVTCPPVIGGILVYRQTSHVTDAFARSCTAILRLRLAPLLG